MNLLFICSKNQWRSPTAETIYKNHPFVCAKSAGISASARTKLNQRHMEWANLIFVMETKHRKMIVQKFGNLFSSKKIIVLDIADEYQYMDPELVEEITQKVSAYL